LLLFLILLFSILIVLFGNYIKIIDKFRLKYYG
jgi:hypothetical protein